MAFERAFITGRMKAFIDGGNSLKPQVYALWLLKTEFWVVRSESRRRLYQTWPTNTDCCKLGDIVFNVCLTQRFLAQKADFYCIVVGYFIVCSPVCVDSNTGDQNKHNRWEIELANNTAHPTGLTKMVVS